MTKFLLNHLIIAVLIMLPGFGLAQSLSVSGKVTDNKGAAVPGVTITEKGTKNATATDVNGAFKIVVKNNNTALVCSLVGFLSKEVSANSQQPLKITIEDDTQKLNEVVVIGYGTQKKADLTGALSSVNAGDFKSQPVTSVAQVLQGRAAGVTVMSNSGAPGGDASIRIRGNNSIQGDNNPLYVIDGFVGADYSAINPQDIESIQILKDASSVAIYGSRGANGVVLIATKKGKSGDTQVLFTVKASSAQVLKKLSLLNAAQYAETVNAKALATGTTPIYTQAQIDQFAANGGTNWQNEVFRTAPTQEYQLNLAGGKEKTTYYIGANYLNQQGILNNSYLKRYALRSNLESKVTDKFSISFNFYVNRQQGTNLRGNLGRQSPVTQALAWAPTVAVFDAAGNYTLNDPVGSITSNPVALEQDQELTNITTTANGILDLRYKFSQDLSLTVTGGANYANTQGYTYVGPSVSQNLPSATRSSLEGVSLQQTDNLTYSHLFGGVHRLTATAVFEFQNYQANGFSATGNNLTFPNLTYYNLALASTYGVGTNYSNNALSSLLGRVNYAYKDKYLVTFSIRRDGSSKFTTGNQYSTFPSVGLGWRLSEEPFIKQLNFFDNLKLRGSYGSTGNQAINPYQTLTTYGNVSTSFISGTITPGILMGNPGNPLLKWETTKQVDGGIDMEILKNRLSFSADYYHKSTSNLLLPVTLPLYLGGGSILSNVGKVNNWGYEFSLSGDPIVSKDLKWSSSFNFSLLNNKVVSLANGQNIMYTGSSVGSGLSTQSEFVLIPGQRLGTYWGLTYEGTWKPSEAAAAAQYGAVPGDAKYLDLNNDQQINGSDYHPIGNGLPKYSYGWNNNVTYKDFTLNVFIQALTGFSKLNYTYGSAITANSDNRQATIADILNRYIPGVNETSNIPGFSKTNKNYIQSTRFMESGNFARLKNISLAYNFSKDKLKKVDLSVFVSATNLWTITGYKGFDPESSSVTSAPGADVNQGIDYGAYPNAKTYTVGLTAKF
ncbi:SusC/RagA family TonB-linked outer membrane protein [Pedobacter jeongneungensis]|uniref:SusC/RagA family TonB-linked outer membrane protein n=1 Tax=Pedobacter jeongneungensis TaxID=947309 RepID=UPI000469C64D|nr:TonB-dependent receptor [Pedobacter jeongneungensis]